MKNYFEISQGFTDKNFFISSVVKIERVKELKTRLFEKLFLCRWHSSKICRATCIAVFTKHDILDFWDNGYFLKHYKVKVPQSSFNSFNCSNKTSMQVFKFLFALDK